jgi:hypothetical protein
MVKRKISKSGAKVRIIGDTAKKNADFFPNGQHYVAMFSTVVA